MTAAPAPIGTENAPPARERRCIVTGEVLSDGELVRFVIGPDGALVPDVAAKLPGRGFWVSARRPLLERAVAKGHFSRAAKAPVAVAPDLCARVESLLVARLSGELGLARRAGQLICGFDSVVRALERGPLPAVLIEASDGAADGRRKLLAKVRGAPLPVIDGMTGVELSLALGRENVIHAALKSGRFAERITADAGRLRGFRPSSGCSVAFVHGPDAGNKGCE
ncbi:MAG: RNA-binding protein [Rhizomicrobium sp.]